MKAQLCVLLGLLFFLISCSLENYSQSTSDEVVSPNVIYGKDDRLDFYQITHPIWSDLALSTVALISGAKMKAAPGGFTITPTVYGPNNGLCVTEPFYNQISASFCSGALIAPDIVMTAGHCVRNLKSCQTMRFVFNFAYHTPGVDPTFVLADDVYNCKELIVTKSDAKTFNDYALIRIDRKVAGRRPLSIRRSGRIKDNEPLVVIGYPKGLPLKLSAGANVRKNYHRHYFSANLDTYDGNSGSAVFNENTGEVEGILVRGESDFQYANSCYFSNVCKDEGCRGEDVTRVTEIIRHLTPDDLN